MGVLANHVPSIEQLRPGLVEIIEESGGSKQFFCTCRTVHHQNNRIDQMSRHPVEKKGTAPFINMADAETPSVGRVRDRATGLSIEHQCRRRVPLGPIQC